MPETILIIGHGYVSGFLSKALKKQGWCVYATSRSVSDPVVDDTLSLLPFGSKQMVSVMKTADAILSTVPPAEDGDPVLLAYQSSLLESAAKWIGYLSATSVYGDHQGAWVDESSECHPNDERSKRRYEAERQWLGLYARHDLPVHVFRLSGIYGPGRNALERMKHHVNPAIVKEGHTFSRTHVCDICQALEVSLAKPTPGEIYNVSDDEPAPLHEVQAYAADLLRVSLTTIPYDQADLSAGMRSFFEANKKVGANKIKEALNFHWLYPSYREGLLSVFDKEEDA